MRSANFTDEQLKEALRIYLAAGEAELSADQPLHVFSERHEARMRSLFSAAARKRNRQRLWKHAAAVLIVLLLSFGMVTAFSAEARAAILNWFAEVRNTIVEYRFLHNKEDHTSIICDPGSLPEGFERVQTVHKDNYTLKLYNNAETDDFIRFEYSATTDAMIKEIETQRIGAELLIKQGIMEKYYKDAGSLGQAFWYDHQRHLVFFVDSSLSKADLAQCIERISFRLPKYEPTWLPEGYVISEEGRENVYPMLSNVYYDNSGNGFIYTCCALEELDGIMVDRLGDTIQSEHLWINNNEAYFYPASEKVPGADLIIVDESNGLVFELNGLLERDVMIKIAESIKRTEIIW